jgi:mRNA-degrading endonuclease RelE of RelBE toxin-antitoxin system
MVIVETKVFTKQVTELLTDDEYRALQEYLNANPESGDLIIGSGGLRKIRWSINGRGKRGGVRIIYYWAVRKEIILMLLMYAKSDKDDLTSEQTKILKRIIEEEFK